MYKLFLYILLFFVFNTNSYSQVIVDTATSSEGRKFLIKKRQNKTKLLFKNDIAKLKLKTIPEIDDNGLRICYKLLSINEELIYFKEDVYKVKTAKYIDDEELNFKISLGENIIKTKYLDDEKIIAFKENVDIKFYGYRKFNDEINFFFCVKNKQNEIFNFFIRVFLIKDDYIDKNIIFVTYSELLPSINNLKRFCKSKKHWNDLSFIPCKYK